MITIATCKPSWPNEFKAIAVELRKALGELALRIDHIGSTAVPGLDAKDRIDIQVTVERLEQKVEDSLTSIGYKSLEFHTDHPPIGLQSPSSQWAKWVFKPAAGQRPTNLHVRISGRPNQRYALLFRDYLRNHPPQQAHMPN